MKKLVVAIDGPAGAGKSTVARIVAQKLDYTYIDTGAMYRAVAWKTVHSSIVAQNSAAVAEIAQNMDLKLTSQAGKTVVRVDGTDISEAIRTPAISQLVSVIAQNPAVRQAMMVLQRQMAAAGGVVMDGRDIGTHVLPDADIKIFLTASIAERAARRWKELSAKGYSIDLEQIEKDIACRDRQDCEREIAPLIQAKDAVLLDTTRLTIDDAVAFIIKICGERALLV